MKTLQIYVPVVLMVVCSTSLAQATDMGPILSAETKLGTLTNGAQIDVFTFNGQADQTVLIRMSRETGTLSPEIKLYDPDGLFEKKAWDSSCAEIITYPLSKPGAYTITATDYWGSYTGDYSLSLLLIPGPTVSHQDPDGGDIFSGETKTGSLSFAADTDAYTFNGESGQTVTISMSRETGTLSPQIVLCDPDGAVEADTWDSSNAQITAHPLAKTGTYTIVPMDYWGGYTGDYSLRTPDLDY